jgi:hypothetical protein
MLETSEQPAVDWSETSKLDVIARETIDLSPISSAPAECDQVLGRLEGRLVLFTHERFPGREVFTRTILLEPLDGRSSLIEQHRPDPVRTYGLMLQPKDSDGIVCQESQRTPDGTWKNSVMHGVPVYVTFESTDRARLLDLRKTLLGEKSAARCERQDRDREKMQQTMQSAREQMQPAGLAMFAQLREKLIAGHPLDIAGLPPEAAALSGLLEQKLREAEQRAREALAGEPFNPEIQKLLRKFSEPETPE